MQSLNLIKRRSLRIRKNSRRSEISQLHQSTFKFLELPDWVKFGFRRKFFNVIVERERESENLLSGTNGR
jgi:hypothetical protein